MRRFLLFNRARSLPLKISFQILSTMLHLVTQKALADKKGEKFSAAKLLAGFNKKGDAVQFGGGSDESRESKKNPSPWYAVTK